MGYPTDNGNGNYLRAEGMLVVNKNLSDPDAVSAFLECLWGEETQGMDNSSCSLAVTFPPIDEILYMGDVYYNEYLAKQGYDAYWWGYGTVSRIEYGLTVFEDGTTSMHEADAFLRQCVPAPRTYTGLENIIYEELNAYWKETERTAEDTARAIDRRIQLYLDEGN